MWPFPGSRRFIVTMVLHDLYRGRHRPRTVAMDLLARGYDHAGRKAMRSVVFGHLTVQARVESISEVRP